MKEARVPRGHEYRVQDDDKYKIQNTNRNDFSITNARSKIKEVKNELIWRSSAPHTAEMLFTEAKHYLIVTITSNT